MPKRGAIIDGVGVEIREVSGGRHRCHVPGTATAGLHDAEIRVPCDTTCAEAQRVMLESMQENLIVDQTLAGNEQRKGDSESSHKNER